MGDGPAVDEDAQALGAVIGVAGNAGVGEPDAPDREELAEREGIWALAFDVDDAAGVVRVQRGQEASLRVDADQRGDRHRLAVDEDAQSGVDVKAGVALAGEPQRGQATREGCVLGGPWRGPGLEPRLDGGARRLVRGRREGEGERE